MEKVAPIDRRKADHIRIALHENVQSQHANGLESIRLPHEALPELALAEVNTQTTLFGKTLNAPILISSMTGGTAEAEEINRRLAAAAEEMHLAMGLGSQRAALETPELAQTFAIARQTAPHALLFANLGAVQLNYDYTIDDCRRAVDMLAADALILHLNPLQEAVQHGGDTNFSGLAEKIAALCRALEVPVIVKEVGWGISERTARLLAECGVAAIDVAGAGGTSWSQVEMHRAPDEYTRQVAAAFVDWGISTVQSILNVRRAAPDTLIFASGGLKNGVDIAKTLALGASLGGLASPLLKAATQSEENLRTTLRAFQEQIRIALFATGSRSIADFKNLLTRGEE